MKILHIEDNQEIVEPAKLIFESAGHQYHYTLDGKVGLQAIRDDKYDVSQERTLPFKPNQVDKRCRRME